MPPQSCFNMYPLDRDPNDGEFSPIDPNYRGRYFVDPECRVDEADQTRAGHWGGHLVTMSFVLPADLVCEHCILQTVYREFGVVRYTPTVWV